MPACAASTSSSTTPIRVTATPATVSNFPIQPSEPFLGDLAGTGGAGIGRNAGGGGYCGQYGMAGGRAGC
jgi:hypothetical protein